MDNVMHKAITVNDIKVMSVIYSLFLCIETQYK